MENQLKKGRWNCQEDTNHIRDTNHIVFLSSQLLIAEYRGEMYLK